MQFHHCCPSWKNALGYHLVKYTIDHPGKNFFRRPWPWKHF